MPGDAVVSQWLRGVTDLVVLACLEEQPNYGYALLELLTTHGLDLIREATVYAALRRLETAGLCASALVASDSGPARRYYELTDEGREGLRALRSRWTRFSDAVTTVAGGHHD